MMRVGMYAWIDVKGMEVYMDGWIYAKFTWYNLSLDESFYLFHEDHNITHNSLNSNKS